MEAICVTVMDVLGAFLHADMMEGKMEHVRPGVFGAFLHAEMPEDEMVHVRMTGSMVDNLLKIDLDLNGPYLVQEGKEKVLNLRCSKYCMRHCLLHVYFGRNTRKTSVVGVRSESV